MVVGRGSLAVVAGLALAGPAFAGATSKRICRDVIEREAEPQTSVGEVRTFIEKDTRPYDAEVLDCLCENGAHLELLQASRRQFLRATVTTDTPTYDIATADPLTPAEYQVAIHFARRLESEANLRDPLVMHPTYVKAPSWFNFGLFSQILKRSEIEGLVLSSEDLLTRYGQEDALPTGRLARLRGDGTLQTADLSRLEIDFRRFLYVDVESTSDQTLTLRWSLLDLTSGRGIRRDDWQGYTEVLAESLEFNPMKRAIQPVCDPSRGVISSASSVATSPRPQSKRTRGGWSGGHIGTIVAGLVVGAAGGAGLGITTSIYDDRLDVLSADGTAVLLRHPDNQTASDLNIASGVLAGLGGATAVIGLALPERLWRKK